MTKKSTKQQLVKIKKCKKEDCSNITIYSKDSEFVKSYIPEPSKDVSTLEKNKPVQTYQSHSTQIYKKSILEISKKCFNKTINKLQLEVLIALISRRHRQKSLKPYTFVTLMDHVRNLNELQLHTLYQLILLEVIFS